MSVPDIPVGEQVDSLVNWLRDNFAPVFDAIDTVVQSTYEGLESVLSAPSPVVFSVIATVVALLVRGPVFGVFTLLSFLLIDSMGMWEPAMETLALVLVASLVAVALAIPVGIAAARSTTVSNVVKPVLDFMQTMPAFVYLLPAIFFFGIGPVPGIIATIVFSMPPGVRLTELGIRQVDHEMVEAGEAFGTPPARILTGIQIPLALPTIRAGVNQVIMLALSMVVIAGIVGAGGLGAVVFEGITRLDIGLGFEGGLAVVILAIFLDRVTASIGTGKSAASKAVSLAFAKEKGRRQAASADAAAT
jgi:glycine betaine/proline transport system permease protein